MKFERITKRNLQLAIKSAKAIFPYEVHQNEFWPETAYRMSIDEGVDDFAYYLVRNTNNNVIGITGHYPAERNKKQGWIGWYGVMPRFRRRGFGQKILLKTIDIMQKKLKMTTVHLWSGDRDEERAAHRLYLLNGFKQTRRGIIDNEPAIYFKLVN